MASLQAAVPQRTGLHRGCQHPQFVAQDCMALRLLQLRVLWRIVLGQYRNYAPNCHHGVGHGDQWGGEVRGGRGRERTLLSLSWPALHSTMWNLSAAPTKPHSHWTLGFVKRVTAVLRQCYVISPQTITSLLCPSLRTPMEPALAHLCPVLVLQDLQAPLVRSSKNLSLTCSLGHNQHLCLGDVATARPMGLLQNRIAVTLPATRKTWSSLAGTH